MKVASTIRPDDLERFASWRGILVARVLGARLDPHLESDLVRQIKDPAKDEALLANIQAWVSDEILKNDLIRTILVLDGTIELDKVAANGRPL